MLIPFRPLEVRILGCMIEKELTTPEYYPLTLNALTLACNQKSNRHPVLDESESAVREAVLELQKRELCRTVYRDRSRSGRYRHFIDEKYGFSNREKAVLAELFLRGAQTPGELNARASRMAPFDSLTDVEKTLEDLMAKPGGPYVVLLERQPGQKEARYAHLFSGEPDAEAGALDGGTLRIQRQLDSILERVEALEGAVSEIREVMEKLEKER